jgi:hypothetical protein
MKIKDLIIRILRKAVMFVSQKKFTGPLSIIDRQKANDEIFNLLISDKPCMISRFGTTELICVNNYLCVHSKEPYYKKIINYIFDKTHTPWWFEDNFKYMSTFSGVFPPTLEIMEKFSKLYLEDIPLIDILGSFQYYEKFMPLSTNVIFLHFETLYPFLVDRPWTKALEGKKVLVVHPFDTSIKYQYNNRELLFENIDVLPKFKLITYKAIQSAGDNKVPFKDWFEALNKMKNDIDLIDFDICLLGCGAYGLPLAAHIKRNGKKAIHLGGGLQLLFGIIGKRWESDGYFKDYNLPSLFPITYKDMFNKYWIKPLKEDTPENAHKVDGATYW